MIGDYGAAQRVVRVKNSVWLLRVGSASEVAMTCLLGTSTETPLIDRYDPASLATSLRLAEPLRKAGHVFRLRNPDLWDALANSIIRQVIRAGHAKVMYRKFCMAHGQRIETPDGPAYLVPRADVVAQLSDHEFAEIGMAFKASALRNAAKWYLSHDADWRVISPRQLVVEAQLVPRIGPWTAGAAIADFTNDYSLYPYGDLAVRTWANCLDPTLSLPASEPEFAANWQRIAGDQVAELTILTLAWGVRHGQR